MTYLKDFRARIRENDYPGFLKIWEEYCYNDEPDGPELKLILEEVKASDMSVQFGKHVERALSQWRELGDSDLSHDILRLIVDLETTNSIEFFEIVYNYLKERYSDDPYFQDKIRIIGMRSRRNFQGAISHYELLTHMSKGKFVFHNGGWGTCEIIDVSLIREEVVLECDFVIGQKHISFENACKNLIPLEHDHFLARRFDDPDKFEEESKKNPLATIHLLLRDLGPKTAAEIKDELCELVIPEKDWNRWWQTVRSKIRKDTKIASPKTAKGTFRLRDEEVSHETMFHKALEETPPVNDLIQVVYSFFRDFPEALKKEEFRNSIAKKLEEVLEEEDLTPSQKLQVYFFLDEVSSNKKSKRSTEFISQSKNIQTLINDIEITAFKKKALQILRKTNENWQQIFSDFLFTIGQYLLQDYIISQLKNLEQGKLLHSKIEDLLNHPISYPEVFVWYFQKVLSKSELPFANDKGKTQFFEAFFILLDHVENKPDMKDLTKKMVNLMLANRYKIVRDVFKVSSLEQVQEFLLLATKCTSLSEHDIKIIHSLGEVVYPSLRKPSTEPEEEVVWTTEEGYIKTQNRLQQIATVETVENAKEIEAARALGDLRENAEFKAALEKRDRLQSEMKALSSQLNNARVLTTEDVTIDKVGVGVIVNCEDSKGKSLKFTLLGPWDADPNRHILSFQSKLAKLMNGKSVGQKFKFQNEEFTITEIENYFEQK